jgi:hypothetical protein
VPTRKTPDNLVMLRITLAVLQILPMARGDKAGHLMKYGV